jgi:hypothetical protein
MEAYVIGLYFVCVENNNGMNLGHITLCLCEIPKTTDRAGREEKKGLRQPPSCRKGRRNGRTCALSLRPWWTLSKHHLQWTSCIPGTSRSRPPDASQCPRKPKRAHDVSKSASVVIDVYYAGEKKYQLALPQKVQVYRACWVISILKEHSQSQFIHFSSGKVMNAPS